jgi:hypothetical protein
MIYTIANSGFFTNKKRVRELDHLTMRNVGGISCSCSYFLNNKKQLQLQKCPREKYVRQKRTLDNDIR